MLLGPPGAAPHTPADAPRAVLASPHLCVRLSHRLELLRRQVRAVPLSYLCSWHLWGEIRDQALLMGSWGNPGAIRSGKTPCTRLSSGRDGPGSVLCAQALSQQLANRMHLTTACSGSRGWLRGYPGAARPGREGLHPLSPLQNHLVEVQEALVPAGITERDRKCGRWPPR